MVEKKYSLQEIAEMLPPGQLGMWGNESALIFRPQHESDPRVKALLDVSAWKEVKDVAGVIQAFPTIENFNALNEFGFDFQDSDKVNHWWLSSEDGKVQISRYDLKGSILFDYQMDAASFLTGRDRAMLSLSPGLGKTLTSAYAAGMRGFDQVMVVCPASLLFYWRGELEKWADKLPREPFVTILHRDKAMTNAGNFPNATQHWLITNPETVVKRLDHLLANKGGPFDCLILDESIMYKHRDSSRSKAIKDLAQSIDVCWELTGAPATKNLDDMWHQFHILKPRGYASYWRFARKYCIVDDNDWGSKVVANRVGAEKEIKKNFSDIFFARSQNDVLNIPDWIFENIDIPMLKEQNNAYEILRKKFYIELDSLDPNEKITVNNHLSLLIRSIQVASNPVLVGGIDSSGKWNALPELLEIYPGPHIIWVNFIRTGEILRDKFSKFGKKIALANGSTSMEDRNSIVNSFQAGELDVIILNNQVGRFGFNLTRARTAIFVERVYDDSYYQCLHRNRRIGTTHSPVIVNMMSVTENGRKTVDHLVDSVLDYRNTMIKEITAGDLKNIFRE